MDISTNPTNSPILNSLTMATSITQLAELISTSVAGLTKTCSQNGIRIPSLNDQASPEADAQLRDERVSENIKIIVSAAMQLAASVSPAEASMVTMGTSVSGPPVHPHIHWRLIKTTESAFST